MAAEGTDKPRSALELLWSDGTRPTRGPKPALSVERIVRAAIEVADAEGLEALSMQKVAERLGFTSMSLYRYVTGKDQLVDVMMDKAVGRPPDPGGARDWRAMVELWVRALWERYREHPWMLQVQASGPPLGPNQLAWLESLLGALSGTGLANDEKFFVSLYLNGATNGLARLTSDSEQAAAHSGIPTEQVSGEYAQAVERLIDSERFPMLTETVRSGVLHPGSGGAASSAPDYEFGLRRLLDGVEVYVASRRTTG